MSRYLRQAHIERYGALADFDLGPLEPGLNVVYGPNEAGKSTVASFVGGVLFGWDEARGVRNTYRPPEGERAGSLAFCEAGGDDTGLTVVLRGRDADGLEGDTSVVADVDNATYRTMFHLTSDELRQLRNTSDVTARLLSAGSGTGASPAAAYVEIEQRIAAHMSRADDAERSIVRLENELDATREELHRASAAVERAKQDGREHAELAASRERTSEQLAALDAEVARALELSDLLESLENRLSVARADLDDLAAERDSLGFDDESAAVDPALLDLDASADRLLRDRLDEFAEEQAKLARSLDAARENSAASSAAYEALLEVDEEAATAGRSLRNRTLQAAVSVLLPVVFVGSGIPVFIHGRQIHSLSFTALGAGMIVLAFFLAAAALVVFLRPNHGAEALGQRRTDAQWVMLQDRKKLDAVTESRERLERDLRDFCACNGLAAADGSVRQAIRLLDDASGARARRADRCQRLAALDVRASAARDEVAAAEAQRESALAAADLPGTTTPSDLRATVEGLRARRDALAEAREDMSLRFGELGERLDRAREDRSYNRLKLEYHQMACRITCMKYELVELLLAKRMLEESIAAWESRNQPEVYAQASQLLDDMTGGAWTRVAMTGEGRLVAQSASGESREVRHLSLGTCQQLYLALRIAMLLRAEGVGRCIPVLADDILVHFDADRRRAAARALALLAEHRQVIVFTCHRDTVEALRGADPELNYLQL